MKRGRGRGRDAAGLTGAPPGAVALDTPTAPQLMQPGDRMRGVRAGVVVFAGFALANASNAVFHLIAGRSLGPAGYGDLASLLAVLGLVAFPLGGVQFAIAEAVARLAARREPESIQHLYRRSVGVGFLVGGGLALLLVALSWLLQSVLDIDSTTAVVLTAISVVPATFAPIVGGVVQGLERFVLFAGVQVAGPFLRIVFVVPLLALGLGVAGAMGASLAAAVLAVLIAAWYLREWGGRRHRGADRGRVGVSTSSLVPVMAGILAFTSLTTADVIVAKVAFASEDAGVYGGASFIGRLILYIPAAIVAVLLPKVSSRTAVGRRTQDILFKSLAATATVCLLATAVYAVAPTLILNVAFGQEYEGASDLLWLFGVAMTGFALVNVLFVYHVGRGHTRVSWLLCGGAILQLAAFAVLHDSPRELLVVSSAVAFSLLVVVALVDRDEAVDDPRFAHVET